LVDKDMIFDRIDYIRQSLKRLEEFKELSKEEFLANDDYFAIAEHHLRRGIEAILDIGRHICVSDNLGQPQEYREIFAILGIKSKEPTLF